MLNSEDIDSGPPTERSDNEIQDMKSSIRALDDEIKGFEISDNRSKRRSTQLEIEEHSRKKSRG